MRTIVAMLLILISANSYSKEICIRLPVHKTVVASLSDTLKVEFCHAAEQEEVRKRGVPLNRWMTFFREDGTQVDVLVDPSLSPLRVNPFATVGYPRRGRSVCVKEQTWGVLYWWQTAKGVCEITEWRLRVKEKKFEPKRFDIDRLRGEVKKGKFLAFEGEPCKWRQLQVFDGSRRLQWKADLTFQSRILLVTRAWDWSAIRSSGRTKGRFKLFDGNMKQLGEVRITTK